MPDACVSIIIPVKDQAEYVRVLLAGIAEHAPGPALLEVIVVDDGSEVPLEQVALDAGCRYERISPSRGPAAARNHGANVARGDILLFLDADVMYAPGLIEKACSILNETSDIAAVSFFNQPYKPGDSLIGNYGAAIEHFWFNDMLADPADCGPINGFTTRNGAVRKSAFTQIGGFDESYKTNACEDYDFGKRLSARFPAVICRSPVIYHRFPGHLRRLLRNYWVRVTLFVPYFLKKRPRLDKSQASPGEALLRLTGAAAPALAVYGLLPVPLASYAPAGAALALALYVWSTRRFMSAAAKWSQSRGFALKALCIHYVTSLAITAGGVWGLASYIAGAATEEAASSEDE